MKETIIPAGYRLTVDSWENDADNGKTEILSGLSKEQVQFFTDLCKLHSKSSWELGYYGNMYEPSEDEVENHVKVMQDVVSKYPSLQKDMEQLFLKEETYEGENQDTIREFFFDYLYDLGLTGTDYHTRVCERYTVEYVPMDIIIPDVTEEFV